jgi:transposase
MELTDPGSDASVLSEFRPRFLVGQAGQRLLEMMLEWREGPGLLKARGRQRTDATHVLASVRAMNRLGLLAESLRAALNELARMAPEWLRDVAPVAWYERYSRRIEDSRLPHGKAEREAYAERVGQDGFTPLSLLGSPEAPAELRASPMVEVLRRVRERHFRRDGGPSVGEAEGRCSCWPRPTCHRRPRGSSRPTTRRGRRRRTCNTWRRRWR